MRSVWAVLHRARTLLTRSCIADEELAAELESHIALHVDDNVRAGMTPTEARRVALARLGSRNGLREAHRDARAFAALDTLARDVRHGLRLWRRQPVFTIVAIVSLALGIGANTAIFSLIDRVMLRTLPVHEPERLVLLSPGGRTASWTYPAWEQIRAYEPLTAGVAAWWGGAPKGVSVGGHTVRSRVSMVSGSFFEMLGVPAARGRALGRRDDQIESVVNDAVAVISDRYWRARFNAAPGIIGQSILIDLQPFTIVGVMPAGFDGLSVGSSFDVAVPLAAEHVLSGGQSRLDAHGSWWLQVLFRLRPEQTVEAAAAALRGVQPQIRAASLPDGTAIDQHLAEPFGLTAIPHGVGPIRGSYGTPLLFLMGAVCLVLLIACANLAGLLLARANARRHEMGLRLSLGASRARLVGQLLVESLLLAGAGAALGLLVARWASRVLVWQIQTINMPVVLDVPVDWRMVAFALGVALLTAVLFGVGPALHATRADPGATLKDQTRTLAGRPHAGAALGLILVQVSLSFVLVAGAGLFLRSLTGLLDNVRGLDIGRVLIARVYVTAGTLDPDGESLLFDQVHRAAREVSGVSVAAISSLTPVQAAITTMGIAAAGGVPVDLPQRERSSFVNFISPDFFETYGTTLVAGRDFTAADTASAAPAVIVNQAFVRRFLGGREHILGLTVEQSTSDNSPGPERTIVGVVEDATYMAPREAASLPVLYIPMTQAGAFVGRGFRHVSVRAAGGDPVRLARPLTDALTRVSPFVAVDVHTLDRQVRSTITRDRLLASLSSALAALALLLAGVGLYGVLTHAVAQRRREIGVRTALGASPAAVVRLVTWRVATTLVVGLAAGALLALWTGRFVEALLFGVVPTDPATFVAAAGMLLVTGLAAALLPAVRAARTCPAVVLREN